MLSQTLSSPKAVDDENVTVSKKSLRDICESSILSFSMMRDNLVDVKDHKTIHKLNTIYCQFKCFIACVKKHEAEFADEDMDPVRGCFIEIANEISSFMIQTINTQIICWLRLHFQISNNIQKIKDLFEVAPTIATILTSPFFALYADLFVGLHEMIALYLKMKEYLLNCFFHIVIDDLKTYEKENSETHELLELIKSSSRVLYAMNCYTAKPTTEFSIVDYVNSKPIYDYLIEPVIIKDDDVKNEMIALSNEAKDFKFIFTSYNLAFEFFQPCSGWN